MKRTFDYIILGSGIVGLTIAKTLIDSNPNATILVIEKEPKSGLHGSGRNSGVMHSGIYYPKDSLKATLCVEGKELLYQFCKEKSIPYKKTGKLIVAINDAESKELEELLRHGRDNGVDDLTLLEKKDIKKLEPLVAAQCAINSPSTGIFDTHRFMKSLESSASERGVLFAYGCMVSGIEKPEQVSLCISKTQTGKISVFPQGCLLTAPDFTRMK